MRSLTSALVSCVLGVAVVFAVVLVLPSATGHRSLTVLTGSMEPALETGSVVVDEMITPTEARVGDIVTFADPAHPQRTITHRLRDISIEGDTAHMTTKGDANDAPERWDVRVDGQIGRVMFHVPKLGHVRAFIGTRQSYLMLVMAIVLLGAWVLADVWRGPPPKPEHEPVPAGGAA